MDTVEEQYEDVPFDMICHVDSEGHTYDFGYGLNWKGVIYDERVRKYAHHPEKNINKKIWKQKAKSCFEKLTVF